MPLAVEWHQHLKVIEARCWDHVTVSEIQTMARRLTECLAEAQTHVPGRRLYLLFDAADAENMPPLYMMLKEALPVLRYKNRGPMFLVVRSQMIRNIFELSAHVTRYQQFCFSTREDALKALEATLAKDSL